MGGHDRKNSKVQPKEVDGSKIGNVVWVIFFIIIASAGCIKVKWLKLNGSEGQKDQYFFLTYGAYWLQEVWTFVFHQPVFKKDDIGWPQQPPTERVLDINEKLDF